MQKHIRLASIVTLVFKKLVGFREYVPPLCEFLPFGLNSLTYWVLFRRRVQSRTNRATHANRSYAAPPVCRARHRRFGVPVELPLVSIRPWIRVYLRYNRRLLTSGWVKSPSMSKSTLCSTSARFCLVSYITACKFTNLDDEIRQHASRNDGQVNGPEKVIPRGSFRRFT